MKILAYLYEKRYGKPAPYYYKYSLLTIIAKPIRKFVAQVLAPNCPFNNIRILLYRMCGFKIGKHVFIGMRCYLDDMYYSLLEIEDDVIISYGVYFALHGKKQGHFPCTIEKGAYIGMRASIFSRNREDHTQGIVIGEGSVVGACSFVNTNVPAHSTAVGVPCKIINNSQIQGGI